MKTECQIIEENLVSDDFLLKEELSKLKLKLRFTEMIKRAEESLS